MIKDASFRELIQWHIAEATARLARLEAIAIDIHEESLEGVVLRNSIETVKQTIEVRRQILETNEILERVSSKYY